MRTWRTRSSSGLPQLRESLQQQTATADVLKVISPLDVTIVQTCARHAGRRSVEPVCATQTKERSFSAPSMRPSILSGFQAAVLIAEARRTSCRTYFPRALSDLPESGKASVGRTLLDCKTVHVPDTCRLDPEYAPSSARRRLQRLSYACWVIPLAPRGCTPIGVFVLTRGDARAAFQREADRARRRPLQTRPLLRFRECPACSRKSRSARRELSRVPRRVFASAQDRSDPDREAGLAGPAHRRESPTRSRTRSTSSIISPRSRDRADRRAQRGPARRHRSTTRPEG